MLNSCQIKYFPMRLFRDIDEPIICDNNGIFIQNSNSGSKITFYNIKTGKMKSVTMKDVSCFNVHVDNKSVAFEFSGSKRGIGVINVKTLELYEISNISNDTILGGIWNNYIILKHGYDILLYDIFEKEGKIIASCHHILGLPTTGYGICAWLQVYRGKCCIVLYDIKKDRNLIISSPGYINKMYIVEEYLVYQNCSDNKCFIYTYSICSGQLVKVFESNEWVELYKGKDGIMVWTVRKENQRSYVFDVWVCNICNNVMNKILSNCKNAVIPTASNEIVLWVDANMEGDSLCLMSIDL